MEESTMKGKQLVLVAMLVASVLAASVVQGYLGFDVAIGNRYGTGGSIGAYSSPSTRSYSACCNYGNSYNYGSAYYSNYQSNRPSFSYLGSYYQGYPRGTFTPYSGGMYSLPINENRMYYYRGPGGFKVITY